MKSIGSVAVGAGFFFVTVAMFVQGFLPMMIPESRSTRVTRAVRTDLGDVKWLRYDASDYTPLERRGHERVQAVEPDHVVHRIHASRAGGLGHDHQPRGRRAIGRRGWLQVRRLESSQHKLVDGIANLFGVFQ
jgi:hypothetical protein